MTNDITIPMVALIMGSQNDWETMKLSEEVLISLKIPYIIKVISAHRTPERMTRFANEAADKGLQIIIAGAGEVGTYIAHMLATEEQDTYLIDNNKKIITPPIAKTKYGRIHNIKLALFNGGL